MADRAEYLRAYYLANRPRILERMRLRRLEKPEEAEAPKRQYDRRNPERRLAWRRVRYALLTGRLERLPCRDCGRADTHAHHYAGYDRPLDVVWLCAPCHSLEHAKARQV